MNNRAPEKPSMIDRLRTGIQNGWNRFNRFVDRVRSGEFMEETRVEMRTLGEFTQGVGEVVSDYWRSNGNNFGERLRNTFADARNVVAGVAEVIRDSVSERVTALRARYNKEGVVGATLGTVADAMNSLAELPAQISIGLNILRERVELEKSDVARDMQNNLLESQLRDGGTYSDEVINQLGRLEQVREHVTKRRAEFVGKAVDSLYRLTNMRSQREKLARAKI